MPTFTKITVSVMVNASLTQTWKAFTSISSIVQWNFASADWCCPKAINDLRDGGSFNYRMESVDHKHGFDFYGTYTKVVPENRIDYTLDDVLPDHHIDIKQIMIHSFCLVLLVLIIQGRLLKAGMQ